MFVWGIQWNSYAFGRIIPIAANLDYMEFGVGTARRGWIEKKDVLNTLGVAALLKRLAAMRNTGRPARKRKSP